MPDKLSHWIDIIAPIGGGIFGVFFGWLLMLRFAPVKTSRDVLNRLMASFASSATFGVLVLTIIQHQYPWMFESAKAASISIGIGEYAGAAWLTAAILGACGLPGWWIMSAISKFLDAHGEKIVTNALERATNKFTKPDA